MTRALFSEQSISIPLPLAAALWDGLLGPAIAFSQPPPPGTTPATEQKEAATDIQKEILRNGPVIANIETPKYFKYYKMGTLRNDDNNLMIE